MTMLIDEDRLIEVLAAYAVDRVTAEFDRAELVKDSRIAEVASEDVLAILDQILEDRS